MAKHRGYTLVEVLIAMVILTGLMFTANYSYSLYSQYWSGRLGTFDNTMFVYKGMLQLKETIDSALPYIVEGNASSYGFYFLGRAQGVTFVTSAPIFAVTSNDAAVVRIFSEKADKGYQLVYEEAPLSDTLLVKADQQLNFKYRTVLTNSSEPINFSYYGWQQAIHKHERMEHENQKQTWSDRYDGMQTRIQPSILKLNLGADVVYYRLPAGLDNFSYFFTQGQ